MVSVLTIASVVLSFIITLCLLPYWITRAKRSGLVGKDMHKQGHVEVPELGGLVTILGASVGVLSYIAIHTFYYNGANGLLLFAALSSILIATIIGLIDDLLGWKIGLRQYQKLLLTILIALPIMVVNAGVHTMNLPFIGVTELGFLYVLVFVPVGIIGAANGFNMLAGYNGLEAGMGIIQLMTLGWISYVIYSYNAAVIAACMVAALVAFLCFNVYPARIFPGDTLTYGVGASIAIVAILANIEKYALILFTPYFIELILKVRGGLQKESFARLDGGKLVNRYPKWYGLEHVVIGLGRVNEIQLVLVLWGIQVIFAGFSLVAFYIT